MKAKKYFYGIMMAMALCLVILAGCEYENPTSTWEILKSREEIVVAIDRVLPEQAGAASELTVIGANFSKNIEENSVYFDNVKCLIKSCTDTAIVVYRPDIIGDQLTVKVSVLKTVNVAKFGPYKLEAVVEEFGHFAGADAFLAATVDKNENIYLAMGNTTVIRLKSDGSRDTGFSGTTAYNLWTDMKISSDGNIYMARSNNKIFTMPLTGGAAADYAAFPVRNDRVKAIDFDEYGHIFGGGKRSGLVVIRSRTDLLKLGFLSDYDIFSVRVFDGRVYVLAEYAGDATATVTTGIWSYLINPDGSVADEKLILDYGASPFAGKKITDFTFSAAGILYLAVANQESPIMKYDPATGSYNTLFIGLVPMTVDQIIWGNTNYIYAVINRSRSLDQGGQLMRINAGEPGAPYYGRQ